MKKTMFITSVIMVVVMAIALTTSSLAWFSAQGASEVTTSSFVITADSKTAGGLKISKDGIVWDDEINLKASGTQQLGAMQPVLPYEATAGNDILDALIAGDFVTNTVNGNKYEDNLAVSSTTATVKTNNVVDETLYITTLEASSTKNITVDIAWSDSNGLAYTYSNGDAVACVAILANKKLHENADRTTVTGSDEWEIVNIFTSKGDGNVFYGKTAGANDSTNYFAAGQSAGSSYYTLDIDGTYAASDKATYYTSRANAKEVSTLALNPITYDSNNELQTYGDVQEFRVLAWYDGIRLVNNNSGAVLTFELTFSASSN